MKDHHKPARKCHGCPMNMGDACWVFQYPRGQWRHGKTCRRRSDEQVLAAFELWRKQPSIKSRRRLRQEEHRRRPTQRGGEGAGWLRERGLL